MYGYNTTDLSGDFLGHFPVPDYTTPSTFPSPSLAPFPPNSLVIPNYNEFDSLSALMNQEICYATNSNTSSGCSSYGSPSSLTSYGTQTSSSYMQRSVSSQSLQKNVNGFDQFHQPTELLDPDSGPVRKAFSTGDLERINTVQQYNHQSESPLISSESSNIIEGINSKACRYSPEEKKQRIERYRSKRNQRNFNKKIKYVCRKTLADSRPRIRGRFARNKDENEKAPQKEWNQMSGMGDEDLDHDYDENWINVLNAFSVNLIP